MGSLRTFALVLLILPAAPVAQATALGKPDLMQDFANCAGRLSALVEFQWLTDGPASEATARARDAMIALTEAVTPVGADRAALHLRIEAKAAQAGLLHAAHFRADRRAGDRAEALLAECRALHLG